MCQDVTIIMFYLPAGVLHHHLGLHGQLSGGGQDQHHGTVGDSRDGIVIPAVEIELRDSGGGRAGN